MPDRARLEHGPFDIIGDVHGCGDELELLLGKLGWEMDVSVGTGGLAGDPLYRHPEGRVAVFLGDLADRGPRPIDCLRLIMRMQFAGHARCVLGNHDDKLRRRLMGRKVQVTHGLEQTLDGLMALPLDERELVEDRLQSFLGALPTHLILDGGRLLVAHAGLREDLQGLDTSHARNFALYGDVDGSVDEHGLPIRGDWPAEYHGEPYVVYGHTPVETPVWRNRTLDLDTGCVFGHRLTALRYPEMELVDVNAARVYTPSTKPFLPEHFRDSGA